MKAYVLRRLLLMIPTFFGISVVLFAVMNLAPGKPGKQGSAETARSEKNEQSQESYRIFREQFDLDKPVFLDTRFLVRKEEVLSDVRTAAGLSGRTAADRLRAEDRLEEHGDRSVSHLIAIAREADAQGDGRLRDAALGYLRLAAPRRIRDPFADRPSAETRAYNQEVDAENEALRRLRAAPDAPEEEKRAVLQKWGVWYDAHRGRFERSLGEHARNLFLETRFARYWRNLFRLDFGVSLVSREPVLRTLVSKLRYSLTLSVGSLVLAYLLSIPLGIFSAVRKDSPADRAVTVVLFMLYSLPSFFVATLLLHFFSLGSDHPHLRLFPTGGFQSPEGDDLSVLGHVKDVGWHLLLPLFCLTYGSLAALSRYMRSGLLEVLRADYVRTARAKGLPERTVIGKHALRNGLLPVLTLLAGLLPAVLGGSVIVEYIFGIPGMGLWIVEAIYQRDYNVILVVELFSTVLVLVGILLTDLSYALVDPRIRYE